MELAGLTEKWKDQGVTSITYSAVALIHTR